MTPLAELRALHEAATPGDWKTWRDPLDAIWRIDHKLPDNSIIVGFAGRENNARLIVAMRNNLAELLARVEAAELDALRYRWLRDESEHFDPGPGKQSPWPCFGINHTDAYPIFYDDLDKAIDAALEGKTK